MEDPKVRHELGEGGAPPAAAKRLAALDKEYKIAAKTMMGTGYNGTMLDCELLKVKKKPVFCNEEVRIQHIVGGFSILLTTSCRTRRGGCARVV